MEYRVISLDPWDQLETKLNDYAATGWRVVQIIPNSDTIVVVFERSEVVYK